MDILVEFNVNSDIDVDGVVSKSFPLCWSDIRGFWQRLIDDIWKYSDHGIGISWAPPRKKCLGVVDGATESGGLSGRRSILRSSQSIVPTAGSIFAIYRPLDD